MKKIILILLLITINPKIGFTEEKNYKIQYKTAIVSQYLSEPGFTLSKIPF